MSEIRPSTGVPPATTTPRPENLPLPLPQPASPVIPVDCYESKRPAEKAAQKTGFWGLVAASPSVQMLLTVARSLNAIGKAL